MSGFCARREMPRAHKNFRLRRASKQPLSDVSRAGKQVWTGQKMQTEGNDSGAERFK